MLAFLSYEPRHFQGVKSLWEAVFPNDPPWNRAEAAIPAKVAYQPDLLIVADDGAHVVGTIMAGYDGHRGWLYSLAVSPDLVGTGLGKRLIEEAERRLGDLGCTKVNLQVRATNGSVVGFYRQLGYEVEDRISMAKKLD